VFGGTFEVALSSKELFVSTYVSPDLLSNQLLPITYSSFIVVNFPMFCLAPVSYFQVSLGTR
jgi:hypothetical protein